MALFCKNFHGRHITDNNNLDSNMAHGHDEISIRILKIDCQITFASLAKIGESFHWSEKKLMLTQYIRRIINSW